MLVGAPLLEGKQNSSIPVDDLPKVGMVWRLLGLAEQRLVTVVAAKGASRIPIIVHVRFMGSLLRPRLYGCGSAWMRDAQSEKGGVSAVHAFAGCR